MTQALERLRQDVRDISSTVDSTIVFIDGVVERLREALAGDDPESDIHDLADQLEDSRAKLANAVAANTASENDGEDEADHGPIDDSAIAPDDGSPATDETLGGEPVEEEALPDDETAGGPTVGDIVTQAPSEDQPGDVDHVPAESAPTATTGNPDQPEADDTAGQVSDNT